MSPYFTLDPAMVHHAVVGLRAHPGVDVAYAVKVNPHPALLAAGHAAGIGAEVVCARELDLALAAGFPGERIVVNGPVKPPELMVKALGCGATLHVESSRQAAELATIADRGRDPVVGLRVRVAASPPSRFGLTAAEIPHVLAILQAAGVRVRGLHVHHTDGLNGAGRADWERRLAALTMAVSALGSAAAELVYLDWGGGLVPPQVCQPTTDDFRAAASTAVGFVVRASAVLAARAGTRAGLRVVVEPGRFLVEHAGALHTRCVDEQRTDGRRVAVLDAGVGLLAGHDCWLGCYHGGSGQAGPADVDRFAGPSCMEEDVLPERPVLGAVRVGDPVVLCRAGAYQLAGANRFYHDAPEVQVRRWATG